MEITEEDSIDNEASTSSQNYNFHLSDFEGPLDLLLSLIKKNDINIYDIPIADITEQFLSFIKLAEKIGLEHLTEFYLMAATLLYIKSRMLLPIPSLDLDDEIEDPRRELVEQLIEYQKLKKLSTLIEEKEKSSEWVIERKKKQRILPFGDDEEMWEKIDIWDLVVSFKNMLGSISSETIINLYEEVSINEKITLLDEILEERDYILFTDLIIYKASIMDVVCAFLAVLECVKNKKISIYQNRFFGDIRIQKQDYIEEPVEEPVSEETEDV